MTELRYNTNQALIKDPGLSLKVGLFKSLTNNNKSMWPADNAIFNVNGQSESRLRDALNLAFNGRTVGAFKFIESKGLVLYSYASSSNTGASKFPAPLNANEVSGIVIKWLQSDEAKSVPCTGWDADADHDGDNELGWRVYTEDWGHVDGEWDAIAIKPAYMWYGK